VLRFDWNGLLAGDRVLVHTSLADDLALAPGVVTRIERNRPVNSVGIRVGTEVLWPTFPAVHRDQYDPDNPAETCWRCQGVGGKR
jgi:hypothetical protein